MQITNITLGSDPEGWIINKQTGKAEPITNLLGGDKGEPISFLPGYGYQEDNCSWEFNIPPCSTKEEFIDSFTAALEELENVLPNHILKIQPSIEFDPEMITDKKQVEIGCSEDFSAYTYEKEQIPDLSSTSKRFAGGHIHIGYEDPAWDKSVLLCKHLDAYLGLIAVFLDTDTERKKAYGTPGRHRIKDYGVEYRTLSNFWIKSPDLISLIWDQTHKAIKNMNDFDDLIEMFSDDICKAITTNDEELALQLINQLNIIDIPLLHSLTPIKTQEHVNA